MSLSFCSTDEDSSWTCSSSSPTLSVSVSFSSQSSEMKTSLEWSSLVSSSISLNANRRLISLVWRLWEQTCVWTLSVFRTCLCWCWTATGGVAVSRPRGSPPWRRPVKRGRRGSGTRPARPSSQPRCELAGPPANPHGEASGILWRWRKCTGVLMGTGGGRRTSCRSWILVSSTCCMWSISCCRSWHRLCSSASLLLVKLSAVVLKK